MATKQSAGLQRSRGQKDDANAATRKVEQILLAARSVFLEHGFSAATTDTIQRAARVSKSTVYAAYPTKESLFAAVIEHECIAFTSSLRRIRTESDDIAQCLTALARAYLNIILTPSNLALYRVIVAEAPRFPALARRFYEVGPKVVTITIERYLEQAEALGHINLHAVGAAVAASQFLSLVRGEAQLECLTHPESQPSNAQMDRWVAASVRTFLLAFCMPL